MPVKVITETGDEIPLEGDLANGGPAADAYVAEQRATLSLPSAPLDAKDVAAFVAERAALGGALTTEEADQLAATIKAAREAEEAEGPLAGVKVSAASMKAATAGGK